VITSLRMHTDTITNCTLLGSFDCDSFYKWIPLKPNRWLVAISFEVDIPYHLWNINIYIHLFFLLVHHNYASIHHTIFLSHLPIHFPSPFDLRWDLSLRWIRVVLLLFFFHRHLKAFKGLLRPRQGNLNFICNNLDFKSLIYHWTSMLLNAHFKAF